MQISGTTNSGKGNLRLGGEVGSPITQDEMSRPPLLLTPPGKAGQLLCDLGTVCPDERSYKENGNEIPEPTLNFSHK